jgi:hypothetical protein
MAYDPNTDTINPELRRMLDVYVECIVWGGMVKHDAALKPGAEPHAVEQWVVDADSDNYAVWKMAHERAKLDPEQWNADTSARTLLRLLNDPWTKPNVRVQIIDRLNLLRGVVEMVPDSNMRRSDGRTTYSDFLRMKAECDAADAAKAAAAAQVAPGSPTKH